MAQVLRFTVVYATSPLSGVFVGVIFDSIVMGALPEWAMDAAVWS